MNAVNISFLVIALHAFFKGDAKTITCRHQFRYFDKICCCTWKKIVILGQRKYWLICNAFPVDSSDYNKTIFSASIKDVKTARLV